ncbi:MAG TPA: hypothetical protein VH157_08690 [Bryobacteraceae bacterium]|nr:hypothetical protein [Bryobacteraceae bacterium]
MLRATLFCCSLLATGIAIRPGISAPFWAGEAYCRLPVGFEPNQGRADGRVMYLSRVAGYTLFVASGEIALAGHNSTVLRMKLVKPAPTHRGAGSTAWHH